jgi:hypothetical protein
LVNIDLETSLGGPGGCGSILRISPGKGSPFSAVSLSFGTVENIIQQISERAPDGRPRLAALGQLEEIEMRTVRTEALDMKIVAAVKV